MKTRDVLKTQITGKFMVEIGLSSHCKHNITSFDNLGSAIRYVNSLTFKDCQAECSHTNDDVFGCYWYDIDINLIEDSLGEDCETEAGLYPIIYSWNVVDCKLNASLD